MRDTVLYILLGILFCAILLLMGIPTVAEYENPVETTIGE